MPEPEQEKYIESIIIRQDNIEIDAPPSFQDADVDGIYEFEGTIKLKQIIKSVQNAVHNRHDYVFEIVDVAKIQKQGD